jgi:hypothetical protein
VDVHVGERFGQPGRLDERQEVVLGIAAGAGAAGGVQRERLVEHRKPVTPVRPRPRRLHGVRAEAVPERRLVDDVGELERRPRLGQVDEHPRDGGDPDAVVNGDVAGIEPAASVDQEPCLRPALAGGDDFDRVSLPAPGLPEDRCAQTSERGAVTGGEHGGHPAPFA